MQSAKTSRTVLPAYLTIRSITRPVSANVPLLRMFWPLKIHKFVCLVFLLVLPALVPILVSAALPPTFSMERAANKTVELASTYGLIRSIMSSMKMMLMARISRLSNSVCPAM